MNTHLYKNINDKMYKITLSQCKEYTSIEVYEKTKRGLNLQTQFVLVKGHPKHNPYYYFRVLNEEVKIYFSDIEKYKEKSKLLKYANKIKISKKGNNYIYNFLDELAFKMQIINECRI